MLQNMQHAEVMIKNWNKVIIEK